MKQVAGRASSAARADCHVSVRIRGVAAEGGDADAAEVLLARLAAPAPAELDRVPVGDARLGEGVGERNLVELRIAARPREAADVDEGLDTAFSQGRDELVERPDAVTQGVHVHTIAASMVGRGGRWPIP